MKSSKFTRFSEKIFKKILNRIDPESIIEKNTYFEKADILLDYKEYLAMASMTVLIGFACSIFIFGLIHILVFSTWSLFFLILIPSMVLLFISLYFLYYPTYLSNKRGRSIDLYLPYAINFINSMAIAGISPSEIFTTLGKIELYGELRTEAGKIAKEINLMGIDNITALKNAIDTSPSAKFKAFIQGIIGTTQAGSELHLYLEAVVEKFMDEDIVDRNRDLELLAVIAEVFVIAVIAFPIFLVIILTVFGFFGGSMELSINILIIFSIVVLPIIYCGFYFLIKSTSLEEINRIFRKQKLTVQKFYEVNKFPLLILGLSAVMVGALYGSIMLMEYFDLITITFYTQLDFMFLGILFLIGPIGIYNYLEIKKKWEIQQRFPDFLVEVGDSLNTGMTIFDAIKTASKAHYGRLTSEINRMKAQLSWDLSMRDVFNNFAERMRSAIVQRVVLTVNRGLDMGGNTPRIFKSAAREVNQVNRLENQRRTNMAVYTLVIFVCFFVFLAIIVILNRTIFTSFFELQESQTLRMGSFTLSLFDPMVLKYAMYLFVFVQSLGAGVLGGFMIDGKLSSGIRYSCILGLISFFIFKFLF